MQWKSNQMSARSEAYFSLAVLNQARNHSRLISRVRSCKRHSLRLCPKSAKEYVHPNLHRAEAQRAATATKGFAALSTSVTETPKT